MYLDLFLFSDNTNLKNVQIGTDFWLQVKLILTRNCHNLTQITGINWV